MKISRSFGFALIAAALFGGCSVDRERIVELEGQVMQLRVDLEVLRQERDEALAKAAAAPARPQEPPTRTGSGGLVALVEEAPPADAALPPAAPTVEILNPTAGVTERNNSWWRYSWRFQLTSHGRALEQYEGRVLFKDSNGLTIDQDRIRSKAIGPGQISTLDGFALVRVPQAARVKTVEIVIEADSGTIRLELGGY